MTIPSTNETQQEERTFERLRTEIELAFRQPDANYRLLSATEVIRRNQPTK